MAENTKGIYFAENRTLYYTEGTSVVAKPDIGSAAVAATFRVSSSKWDVYNRSNMFIGRYYPNKHTVSTAYGGYILCDGRIYAASDKRMTKPLMIYSCGEAEAAMGLIVFIMRNAKKETTESGECCCFDIHKEHIITAIIMIGAFLLVVGTTIDFFEQIDSGDRGYLGIITLFAAIGTVVGLLFRSSAASTFLSWICATVSSFFTDGAPMYSNKPVERAACNIGVSVVVSLAVVIVGLSLKFIIRKIFGRKNDAYIGSSIGGSDTAGFEAGSGSFAQPKKKRTGVVVLVIIVILLVLGGLFVFGQVGFAGCLSSGYLKNENEHYIYDDFYEDNDVPPSYGAVVQNGEGFSYIVEEGTATITEYLFTSDNPNNASGDYGRYFAGTVVVPETIDGYTVTALGNYLFYGCRFESITLPDTLEWIGEGAFSYAMFEEGTVKIPDSVTAIADQAFYRSNYSDIDLPEKLAYIGDFAFAETDLNGETVFIPANVEQIASDAFVMSGMDGFSVDIDNPVYYAKKGNLYKDDVVVVYYDGSWDSD